MTVPRKSAPAKKKTSKRAAGTSKPAKGTKKSSAKPGKNRSVASKSVKKSTKSASRSVKSAASTKSSPKRRAVENSKPKSSPKPKPERHAVHKPVMEKPSGATEKSGGPVKSNTADKQSKRKGISIHGDRPAKAPRRQSITSPPSPHRTQLLGPDAPKRKPLIPSGPDAARGAGLDTTGGRKPAKSPFRKRELDKFRAVLMQKRAALAGDISQLESEALNLGRGELSHTPQHMAEQGSDSAEQTLALDLAAADRKLIREIDDAIKRMDDGRYGLCELTGRPIRVERLRELPWARYSIDAARELERRSPSGVW